jgi:adenylosuccinate synthase
VAVRYACRINGVDRIALTKPDVLEEFGQVLVCTAYRYRGETLKSFPTEPWVLERVTPVYRTLPGWRDSVHGASDLGALPQTFLDYVRVVEDLAETRVAIISTGVEREETILIPEALAGLVDLGKLRQDRPA